ncbi:hypothetical protein LCGC14_2045340, partial [marine sediment metagenome]
VGGDKPAERLVRLSEDSLSPSGVVRSVHGTGSVGDNGMVTGG